MDMLKLLRRVAGVAGVVVCLGWFVVEWRVMLGYCCCFQESSDYVSCCYVGCCLLDLHGYAIS